MRNMPGCDAKGSRVFCTAFCITGIGSDFCCRHSLWRQVFGSGTPVPDSEPRTDLPGMDNGRAAGC